MPSDSRMATNRPDHQLSPIWPRRLRALMPPSTRRGREGGGQSSQEPAIGASYSLTEPLGGQLREPALAAADDQLGERLLLLDQRVDPLLQRADADELADLHVLALADAEGAVGRLVLHGRVPPAVEVDHVIGGGQVQASPAR